MTRLSREIMTINTPVNTSRKCANKNWNTTKMHIGDNTTQYNNIGMN